MMDWKPVVFFSKTAGDLQRVAKLKSSVILGAFIRKKAKRGRKEEEGSWAEKTKAGE